MNMAMARLKKNILKQGHRRAMGFATPPHEAQVSGKDGGQTAAYERVMKRYFSPERAASLKVIPPHIVKKAWFTMAHALLEPGSTVLDVGCQSGDFTYAMAVLNPELRFVGIDINPGAIRDAIELRHAPNLTFQVGNIYSDLGENQYDLIIDSFFLHEAYSASFYNERLIQLALERQYKALKPNGSLIIRDYLSPPENRYVLIEFTDKNPSGDTYETMSDAELLIWFSEHARAKTQTDDSINESGFFLEELPPNYPLTRLFRVPEKWAYEFILRKDNRKRLREELAKEYAFYTEGELSKQLRGLGARISYSAPHWDEGFIKTKYLGAIRLYKEDGTKMGPPPTNHIIVAKKVQDKTSQVLVERRASRNKTGSVYLRSVRNENTGAVSDIICRDAEVSEIIPYRLTAENQLKVYLHEDVPRGLANAVPRSGQNLDGKKWSGHMIEAIGVDAKYLEPLKEAANRDLQKFAIEHIGIKPSIDARLMEGGGFYPDPNQIDERVLTYYMRVEDFHKPYDVKMTAKDVGGFSNLGRIREFDAQDIMNAVAVGLIPTSRLEVQILGLYQMLGLKAETWSDLPLQLSEIPIEDVKTINDILKQYSLKDSRFKPMRGRAGNVRLVQSVFVDEGREAGGGVSGLAARDLEFAVPENKTTNTAVILPLVRNLNGEVMAGILTEYMPVPQRYAGSGFITSLPTISLPKEVTDMEAARHYVAEQFKVKPEHVARMGESFFAHIGVTPHRIFPFAVTDMRGFYNGTTHGVVSVTMLRDLWKLLYWDNHDSFLKVVAVAYQHLVDSNDLSLKHDFDIKISDKFQQPTASSSTYLNFGGTTLPTPPLPTPPNFGALPQNLVVQQEEGEGSGSQSQIEMPTFTGGGETPTTQAAINKAQSKVEASATPSIWREDTSSTWKSSTEAKKPASSGGSVSAAHAAVTHVSTTHAAVEAHNDLMNTQPADPVISEPLAHEDDHGFVRPPRTPL